MLSPEQSEQSLVDVPISPTDSQLTVDPTEATDYQFAVDPNVVQPVPQTNSFWSSIWQFYYLMGLGALVSHVSHVMAPEGLASISSKIEGLRMVLWTALIDLDQRAGIFTLKTKLYDRYTKSAPHINCFPHEMTNHKYTLELTLKGNYVNQFVLRNSKEYAFNCSLRVLEAEKFREIAGGVVAKAFEVKHSGDEELIFTFKELEFPKSSYRVNANKEPVKLGICIALEDQNLFGILTDGFKVTSRNQHPRKQTKASSTKQRPRIGKPHHGKRH